MIHFTVDGRSVTAEPGQTIAAALLTAGQRPRLFCAIGVCFDCAVTVNGVPAQRACLLVPRDGDEVVTRA
jgi:aerobic-type carbon monoxide dehydrogenase small subunit (CoxS/CutS family)